MGTVVEVLTYLGGVAPRPQVITLTSRRRLERALATGDVEVLRRGVVALPGLDAGLRRAHATGGVLSHQSAALWWGWGVALPPQHPEITLARGRRVEVRQGVHRTDLHPDEIHDGVVTTPERTFVDCCRTLPWPDALAVADSALRGGISHERAVALAASVRGPGAPQVRRAARYADERAANPFESVMRALAIDARLDVTPQLVIRDHGESVRPDLVDERRRLVLEADSLAWHGSRKALRRDCHRYNWLTVRHWRVLRFPYEDVMHHREDAAAVMEAVAPMYTEVRSRRPAGRMTRT